MLATFIACALAGQAVLPKQLEGVSRIVMLGDSITQLGAQPKGYVTLVASALKAAYPGHPIEVINAGISGHKATDMADRFQKDVLDKKPDLITISVGVNDVWHEHRSADWKTRLPEGGSHRGVPLPLFTDKVGWMIDQAKKAHVRVVLLSPTLVYEDLDCEENRDVRAYVRAGEQVAKSRGAQYVNLHRAFRRAVDAYQEFAGKQALLLTTDGVHLNDAGNALMAGMILKALGVPLPDNVRAK